MLKTALSLGLLLLCGCAGLHHVEIGDIDNSRDLQIFDVKVSETGVDIGEAARLSKVLTTNKTLHKGANAVENIWKLMTYGPRTGNVIFSEDYADGFWTQVYARCPANRIAGFAMIRESNKYPVISGEIVRMIGYCKGKSI